MARKKRPAITRFPLGIEPSEINDETGYIHAGQVLRVDYVLVGNMEKVGDFVEVTFRMFTMPRGIPKEYPGGKTLDLFVKQEIPKIVAELEFQSIRIYKQIKLSA